MKASFSGVRISEPCFVSETKELIKVRYYLIKLKPAKFQNKND